LIIRKILDKVFSDITWGTDTVFKEQTDRAKSLGISLGILETVLSDVVGCFDLFCT
jgi:glycosyltransferase A (GT-A) superfamily protein (DUF2064 family)